MNSALLRQVVAHLQAGEWTAAHNLVQQDDSPMAAWLHGIVHIQEGDLEDAEYWYAEVRHQTAVFDEFRSSVLMKSTT